MYYMYTLSNISQYVDLIGFFQHNNTARHDTWDLQNYTTDLCLLVKVNLWKQIQEFVDKLFAAHHIVVSLLSLCWEMQWSWEELFNKFQGAVLV